MGVVCGSAACGCNCCLLNLQAIFAGVQDRVQGSEAVGCGVLSLLTGFAPDWEVKLCKQTSVNNKNNAAEKH